MVRPLVLLPIVGTSLALAHLLARPGEEPFPYNNGPDHVAGELNNPGQFGSEGTQVALAIAPTECNAGNQEVNCFGLPSTDHAVMIQNLYRMSGGLDNTQRFEQIGQSWAKHRDGAEQSNKCNFDCKPSSDPNKLGIGCSDTYSAQFGAVQGPLGSRAWVNPYTGEFPANAKDHSGHVHTARSHRLVAEAADLDTTQNAGANYFFELQFVTPHEYTWCAAHPGECNMFNNASHRQFFVSGTSSFTFSPAAPINVGQPAIYAWTGATIQSLEPAPLSDGLAYVGYKVTGPVDGLYHYEYAIYNYNLDRAIQSFSVPLGCGINVSNVGFHAPWNEPGVSNDGTVGDAGFSNAAWTSAQTSGALTWSSETFAQNQNANAVRWGTLFSFRFDSDRAPHLANATIGFFKTGAPMSVAIEAPSSPCAPLQVTSAVSRKNHGDPGDFALNLPLTGPAVVESRDGGPNGDFTLVFTFSNTVVNGSATVTPESGGSVSGTPVFSGNTMTVNLTGIVNAQQLTVTAKNVTDSFAQTMSDVAVPVAFLVGDANGDGFVNSGDAQVTRNRAGQPTSTSNFRSDVNHDGAINSGDATIVRARSGSSLTP